jgi:hypothetical protein
MESVIENKASTLLQFIDGLRGDLRVTFEEGTWAAWLYDLLKPHVTEVVVCNPRKNALLKDGSKSDRIDANKLSEQLYMSRTPSPIPRHTSRPGFRDLRPTPSWSSPLRVPHKRQPTTSGGSLRAPLRAWGSRADGALRGTP